MSNRFCTENHSLLTAAKASWPDPLLVNLPPLNEIRFEMPAMSLSLALLPTVEIDRVATTDHDAFDWALKIAQLAIVTPPETQRASACPA